MDPYAVVGVDPASSDAEIRDAYVRRSKELHPDRFADAPPDERARATRAMQELNAAYAALRERSSAASAATTPLTPPPPPPPPPPRRPRRVRWVLIPVTATMVASVLVLLSGDARNPASPTTTTDLVTLEGECLVLDSRGGLEDVVDCTRPHDARVVKVVDHGTPCPVWAHATMAFPRQDLCLDTHQ